MIDELKPCPFCGGPAYWRIINQKPLIGYEVFCGEACCPTKPVTWTALDKHEAIAKWNTRAVPTGSVKPLVWRVETWTHGIARAFGLEIEIRRDKLSHHKIGWQLNWVDGDRVIRASYASVDEAKAAAQAWYEAKVRECLE